MLLLFRSVAPLLALLLATVAEAHPFLGIEPIPSAAIESGSSYDLAMDLFPGDTAVEQVQFDFELSSLSAFGVPSPVMGSGFTFVYDSVGDPLHFSIVGDFSGSPLAEFGVFPVAQFSFVAGAPGGTLLMLDSSFIVALEGDLPEIFNEFSNVHADNVVAHVVPEPSTALELALGLAALVRLSRPRR